MKLSEGVLHFLKSKNPPVFGAILRIVYKTSPKKGQAFVFNRAHRLDRGYSALSTVQKITKFDGFSVIKTLNSYYVLVNGVKNEAL